MKIPGWWRRLAGLPDLLRKVWAAKVLCRHPAEGLQWVCERCQSCSRVRAPRAVDVNGRRCNANAYHNFARQWCSRCQRFI